MDHPLLVILCMWPILYLSAFLHEVGHCLVGRAAGYTPTSLGMGTGKPFFVTSWRGVRIYLARTRPLQGLIFLVHTGILPSRAAAAWTMAGGILAHAVLAAVFASLSLLLPSLNAVWLLGLGLNLMLGLVNLVPLSIRMGNAVLRSDGAQILMHLRDGLVETPPTMRTQTVEVLHPLWTQIGDSLGLYGHLSAAALAWGELNDSERALRCFDEVRALPVEHSAFVESYTDFVGVSVLRQAGRLEEARAAYERAIASFRAQGHAAGTFLMELSEGELLLAEGKPAEAAAVLDRLVQHPEVRQRPALAASLLTGRLVVHLEAGSDQSEALLKEWERVRLRYPSPVRDQRVLLALGRARARQGRREEAAAAYERMLGALRQMHEGLVGLPEAAAFGTNHAAIAAEAREALRQAGLDPSPADPETLFPTPERLREQVTGQLEAQNRRRHRIGFWWSVANLFLSPILIVGAILIWRPAPGVRIEGSALSLLFLGLALGFVGLIAMAYSLYLKVACRWLPGLRSNGGQTTLVLAAMPWITWLMSFGLLKR